MATTLVEDEEVFDLTTKLKLSILQGRALAAKDRNALGQKTTSDPYVEIWAYNTRVGTTSVKKKTLNPDWRSGDGENEKHLYLHL